MRHQQIEPEIYWPRQLTGRLLALLGVLLGLAVLFRLSDLGVRNLWTDEAWVALAALKSTPAAALAAGQSTPPLYLLTLWALAQVFGGSEVVLRSLSFILGMGTVFLFWLLARKLVRPGAALVGLAAVACSPVMVYFSKELKQYSGDAFFAVLMVLLAERWRSQEGAGGWLALAGCGVLGLGFSHTLIFILPVVGAVLWLHLPRARPWRLPLLGLLWALSFAAYYLMFYRHQVDPTLVAYWSKDFPDFSGVVPFLIWLGAALGRYLSYFLGHWGPVWGLPALLFALIILGRQGPRRLPLYLGGPLLLALAASALHRYPFMAHHGGSRLMLFSAPMLYLVVAVGMTAVWAYLWQKRQRLMALSLAALLLMVLRPVELVLENLHPAMNRSEIQPLVVYLERHLKPTDRIYVYYHAIYPFRYYFRGDGHQVIFGKSCVEAGLVLPEDNNLPASRLWLIGGHFPDLSYMQKFVDRLLGPDWQEMSKLTRPGAVLFELSREGAAMAGAGKCPPGPDGSGLPVPPAGRVW